MTSKRAKEAFSHLCVARQWLEQAIAGQRYAHDKVAHQRKIRKLRGRVYYWKKRYAVLKNQGR